MVVISQNCEAILGICSPEWVKYVYDSLLFLFSGYYYWCEKSSCSSVPYRMVSDNILNGKAGYNLNMSLGKRSTKYL